MAARRSSSIWSARRRWISNSNSCRLARSAIRWVSRGDDSVPIAPRIAITTGGASADIATPLAGRQVSFAIFAHVRADAARSGGGVLQDRGGQGLDRFDREQDGQAEEDDDQDAEDAPRGPGRGPGGR